jgi:hypothetical protein
MSDSFYAYLTMPYEEAKAHMDSIKKICESCRRDGLCERCTPLRSSHASTRCYIFKERSRIVYESNRREERSQNDTRFILWNTLFPGQPIPEPYVSAVDDYEGRLGKLLPTDIDIDKTVYGALHYDRFRHR